MHIVYAEFDKEDLERFKKGCDKIVNDIKNSADPQKAAREFLKKIGIEYASE